jgi:hypothetical protein
MTNADHGILAAFCLKGGTMKRWLSVVCATALIAGCGADVATTAATGAAIKKQEMDAGKQLKETADKKIDAAAQAIQQRAEQQSNADK